MRYYARNGDEITEEQWMRLRRDDDYRRVALTETPAYVVSTVWLGLDHNFFDGKPLFFETMVFASEQWNDRSRRAGLSDIDCDRYGSEQAAQEGHERIVALLRATEMTLDDLLGRPAEEADLGSQDEEVRPEPGDVQP